VDTELSFKLLHQLTNDGMSSITKGNWQGYSHNARTMKKAYYKTNATIYDIIYRIILPNPNEEASS
jgi:hypothetical protein